MNNENPKHALEESFPVVISQEVHWSDMDAFQHVNNRVYFRYFEDARLAYFDKIGIMEHKQETHIGPILASTECNYKLPLEYPDKIYIGTRTSILSPKKVQMDYRVFSESQKSIAAEGQCLLVYYNYDLGRSCEIPLEIVEGIQRLECNSSEDQSV